MYVCTHQSHLSARRAMHSLRLPAKAKAKRPLTHCISMAMETSFSASNGPRTYVCRHNDIHTNSLSYLHTHTYIHTYIHTYMILFGISPFSLPPSLPPQATPSQALMSLCPCHWCVCRTAPIHTTKCTHTHTHTEITADAHSACEAWDSKR